VRTSVIWKAALRAWRDLVLWLAAAALAAFTLTRGIAPHDEGLMLQGASRVAHGQWPYRDFWANYPPGQFVLLAGLQKLFGASLLSWRIVLVAIDATVSVLAYRLVLRHTNRCWALLAWLAVAGAMAWPALPGPNPTALLFGLGALLAAPQRPLLAGALAGVAAWFRIEIGVACAIGAALACWPAPPRAALVRLGGTFAGVAVVLWLPFLIAGGGDAWHDIVGFLGQQDLQRLPLWVDPHTLKPDKLLEAAFPVILIALGIVWAGFIVARRPAVATLAALPLAVVGVGYLLGRSDVFHLVPLSIALAIGLAVPGRTVLIVGVAIIALHGLDRRGEQLIHPPAQAAVPGGVGDGVQTTPDDAAALRGLVPFVRRLTPGGAPVFVAVPRYDRVRVGDPLLNVILRRPNPTRYDVVQPGVVTTAKVQREMVRELADTNVVVVWHDPRATQTEPNGSARSSGVNILSRYLTRAFRPVRRFGVYEVLRRGQR
jgi:hypothetical protein